MIGYDESSYGEKIADIYDDLYRHCENSLINRLLEFSQNGRVLELGIGTGRVALPLAENGVDICGIDASKSMVAKLRAKPGGDLIPVTMGNFADVDVEGEFCLIFVVFNTFLGLGYQKEQIRCLQNVAKHLSEDGVFVIEVFYPDLKKFQDDQNVRTTNISKDAAMIDVCLHDPLNQRLNVQHVVINEKQGIKLYPVQMRYVWPSELDLMANLAGLELKHRWGGWNRMPFLFDSKKFISVYGWKKA